MWTVVAGLVVVLILGVAWTRHVRSERLERERNPDSILDEINQKNVAAEKRRQQELDNVKRASREAELASAAAASGRWPAGLSRDVVIDAIGECEYFAAEISVRIPKEFPRSSWNVDPELAKILKAAEQENLVSYRPERIGSGFAASSDGSSTVRVDLNERAFSRSDVSETVDAWMLGFGKRTVTGVRSPQVRGAGVSVDFGWSFENDLGNRIVPDAGKLSGTIMMVADGSAWRPASIDVTTDDGVVSVCSY